MQKFRRPPDDPTTSDTTLLLKVEDLIGLTFSSTDTNVVNFKILQTILNLLAGQLRMLHQDVEIRFAEEDDMLTQLKTGYGREVSESESEEEEREEKKVSPRKGGKGSKSTSPEKDHPTAKVAPPAKGKMKKGKAKKGDKSEKVDESTSTRVKRTSRGSMTASDSQTRIGSIEVVTASQFNILDSMVRHLLKRTGGVPLPTMPSNEDLLAELAKGTASLPDTMEAMQVNARIRAAEHAITRMAGLLTQLASTGALPEEVALIIGQMQNDLQQLSLTTGIEIEPVKNVATSAPSVTAKPSAKSRMSTAVSGASYSSMRTGNVTHPEMHEALNAMRDELLKHMDSLTAKSEVSSEQASHSVKAVAEKMETALKMDNRITAMQTMTSDYVQQLQGFDAGLGLQLQNFREQMVQLKNELHGGLVQIEAANSNPESAALVELKTNYANLLHELEETTTTHSSLLVLQKTLTGELKKLVECVELLREEKADRDEVADGLRDKANISRLKGLLRQPQFDETRKDLEHRLNLSNDKFFRQEQVWMVALKDLKEITASKASIMDLLALKEFATETLNEHLKFLHKLELALGEPKTALLTRKLARDSTCGPCTMPASMEPFETSSGVPNKLPALRNEDDEEDICMPAVQPNEDTRKHVGKRWVGGSHTLLTEHIKRERATPLLGNDVPTKQYTGIGSDGRLYLFEEELQPCIECNQISPSEDDDGGGDIATRMK